MKLSQSDKIMITGFGLVVVANILGAAMITRELARANVTLDNTGNQINSAAGAVTKTLAMVGIR